MSTQTEVGRVSAPAPSRQFEISQAWLAAGPILLGIGAELVSVLGPLVAGVIEYHASEGAVNQVAGV